MTRTNKTHIAGQALAAALAEVATNGLDNNPQAVAALEIANITADAAMRDGATADDIRNASGITR